MKKWLILFSLFLLNKSFAQPGKATLSDKYVLVIHGGAGTILKSQMTPEKEKSYQAALETALTIGNNILKKGGSALDAVEAAVRSMEDNPLFNAGKGAVFTNDGKNELDAAMMDGKTLAAGSVASVTTIKNPISAARTVMEKSPHVMMTGNGAEKFAQAWGLEIVDPSYFFTEERWQNLLKARELDSLKKQKTISTLQQQLDALNDQAETGLKSNNTKVNKDSIANRAKELQEELERLKKELSGQEASTEIGQNHDHKFGTVGAVALDRYGNLAAATSTGGMTNKRYGRVGDAPIIGAGTYANNATVAISGTGWGEYFIRLVMAKSISDMMEFGKMKLSDAAHEMVMKRLPALGGDGGLIAVDKNGNIALPFCTAGMYRGYIKSSGEKEIKIYKE